MTLYFFPGLFSTLFSHFCSFMVVRDFGVAVFSWWGSVPVVWGILGFFWGWGYLYKRRRITVRTHVPIHYSNSVLFHKNLAPSLLQKIASKKINNKFICIVIVKLLTPTTPKNSNPVWEIHRHYLSMEKSFDIPSTWNVSLMLVSTINHSCLHVKSSGVCPQARK